MHNSLVHLLCHLPEDSQESGRHLSAIVQPQLLVFCASDQSKPELPVPSSPGVWHQAGQVTLPSFGCPIAALLHKVMAMSGLQPQKSGMTELEAKDTWFKVPVSSGLHVLCPIILCRTPPPSAVFEVFAHLRGQSRAFQRSRLEHTKAEVLLLALHAGADLHCQQSQPLLLEVRSRWQSSEELAGGHCPFEEGSYD